MTSDIWDDFVGNLNSLNRRMEEMFNNMMDGDVRTYGYTVYRGPDGVPHVHEFGNNATEIGTDGVREPLTDVTLEDGQVRIVVELPGVDKEDIQLDGSKNSMTVSVDTERKKYKKVLAMPCDVDPDSAKASYNNGLLEITIRSVDSAPNGKRIKVE